MENFPLTPTIKAVQAKLGLVPDGIAGPKTWNGIIAAIWAAGGAPALQEAAPAAIPVASDAPAPVPTEDGRTLRMIATLLPPAQDLATKFVALCQAHGFDARIISGLRTYDEQNALYEQGRTLPGTVVTNARGGFSNHNFGLAFDFGIFEGGKYLDDSPLYTVAGQLGKSVGLIWGGDWAKFPDNAHLELRPAWAKNLTESDALAQYRLRTTTGQDLLA